MVERPRRHARAARRKHPRHKRKIERSSMKAFVYSLGALLLLSIPASVAGQSATTGALSGGVTSSAGATLPNVTVTLTGDATNQPQTATTGADGTYRFSMLAPGSYEVRFALDGFKTARMAQVVVSISEVPTLDAVLDPGASDHRRRLPMPSQPRDARRPARWSTPRQLRRSR